MLKNHWFYKVCWPREARIAEQPLVLLPTPAAITAGPLVFGPACLGREFIDFDRSLIEPRSIWDQYDRSIDFELLQVQYRRMLTDIPILRKHKFLVLKNAVFGQSSHIDETSTALDATYKSFEFIGDSYQNWKIIDHQCRNRCQHDLHKSLKFDPGRHRFLIRIICEFATFGLLNKTSIAVDRSYDRNAL